VSNGVIAYYSALELTEPIVPIVSLQAISEHRKAFLAQCARMPKVAVNENDDTRRPKNDVGPSGKTDLVTAKSEASTMQSAS